MDYSYIYKITYKPTGEYYIGARYSAKLKKPAEEDFLQDYFTSSKEIVKRLVHTNINDWEWELTPMPREQAISEEKRLLNETADDPLCLYKHSKKLWQDKEYRQKKEAAWNDENKAKKSEQTKSLMTPEKREHLRQKGLEQAERQKNIWTDERRAIWRQRALDQWAEQKRNKS